MMRKVILLLSLIWVAAGLMAQDPVPVTRSTNKVIIEGKVYYIHVVEPGQTLYSLARAYNVSQKDIVTENPGTDAGLRIGQMIKIPAVSTDRIEAEKAGDNGFTYYTLKQGETIYAVSRLYGISVERIQENNPGLDIYHLPIGQQIRIPAIEQGPQLSLEGEQVYHKVKRKETLYSISKQYGVTIDAIKEANPQLGWGGPKTGQVLRIPQQPRMANNYSTPEMAAPDTAAYSFLSDSAFTPVDSLSALWQEEYLYDELNWEFFDPGKTYRVAFFIPFNYHKQLPLDSLLKDVVSPAKRSRIEESYQLEKVSPQAVNFLEFYEGALLAVDSALRLGMHLEISFWDTRRSSEKMREILSQPGMDDLDLIIGPFYSFNVEIAAQFAYEHHIPLVTPFHTDQLLLRSNPYFFQLSPSNETECRMAAKYLAREYDKNLIFVHSSDSSELELNEYFKEQLFMELRTYTSPDDSMLHEVIMDRALAADLDSALSTDRKNIVISLTANEAFASTLVTNLYFKRQNYDIELFGSPYFVNFGNIDVRYYHALNLTFVHGFLFNYDDAAINAFLRKFYRNYKNQPVELTRKGISYGMMGYDMSLYFLMGLRAYGPRFIRHLDDLSLPQLYTPYNFVRASRGGGYENQGLEYYQYTKNYEITRVSLPQKPEMHYFFRPSGDLGTIRLND